MTCAAMRDPVRREEGQRVMKQLRGAIAFALLLAAVIPATADTKIEGRYALSIAGLTIGTVAVVLDVRTDGYVVAGSAKLTGVMRAIASAHGTAAVRGNIVGGRLVPQSYVMTAETREENRRSTHRDGQRNGARFLGRTAAAA